MTISYNWLNEYLSEKLSPQELSTILTSLGLEVESLEKFEEYKGGLEGLVIGEVLTCEKHPGADKLKLTTVNTGEEILQIVCGAPNVAVGQKVIVAPVGATIYPTNGEPLTMKKAKIRGEESDGMICASDEIGLGEDHSGIMILPADTQPGISAKDYFKPYNDYVFEIGLTPNRMDAMSHLGVAKDVAAYLAHHHKISDAVKSPLNVEWPAGLGSPSVQVEIRNIEACPRYSGIKISGINVSESPAWLQQRLKSIGLRPINKIVDITNFILHETGQPLHAFDLAAIKNNKVVVETLPEATPFITLDGKERKLSASDLMICNGADEPMCIGGVFGGLNSGVSDSTTEIFLESAVFNPVSIRRSSLKHGLRTDAANRFEKGVDISQCVNVLKRAAKLIQEVAGGKIQEEIIDIYPVVKEKTSVTLKFDYLRKLSGKKYNSDVVTSILTALAFEVTDQNENHIIVNVPFSKPDISIPADIVEEIMRVDGLDNVEIPSVISIAPSVEVNGEKNIYKEKLANLLVGKGFYEIFTNSITNSAYYKKEATHQVRMLNSLSAELDIMRPSMLETGLESVAHNINRQNRNLQFFEFGKTYLLGAEGFREEEQFALYITGSALGNSWRNKSNPTDLFFLKGLCQTIATILNIQQVSFVKDEDANSRLENSLSMIADKKAIGSLGAVSSATLERFSIKQPVYFATFTFDQIISLQRKKIMFSEIAKFPAVHRDLSLVVEKSQNWDNIEKLTRSLKLDKLKSIKLFDVFEHEKLGTNKHSLAIHYTFLDQEKTLTDKETDSMMNKIISSYENDLKAIVRKS